MTLDQLMEEWRKDSPVDSTELGIASLKIPELHSKYLKIYFEERRKLKGGRWKEIREREGGCTRLKATDCRLQVGG